VLLEEAGLFCLAVEWRLPLSPLCDSLDIVDKHSSFAVTLFCSGVTAFVLSFSFKDYTTPEALEGSSSAVKSGNRDFARSTQRLVIG
jgi:hypothetical protein